MVRELGKELSERDGIDDRAGEAVLAELFRFFEDPDLDRRKGRVVLREACELDGAGEASRTASHEEDVHRHRLFARLRRRDEVVDGKRELIVRGNEALRHHTPNFSGSRSSPISLGGAMYPASADDATTAGLAR